MSLFQSPSALRWLHVVAVVLLAAGLGACAATPQSTLPPTLAVTREALALSTPAATDTLGATVTPSSTATTEPTPTVTPVPTLTHTPGPLIALDPGHGGDDLGARHFDAAGRMDMHESAINLALALALRDLLGERGYRVLMTRDTDVGLNPNEEDINGDGKVDSLDDLQARLDLVNVAGADLFLSIHLNAFEYSPGVLAPDVGGSVTFYCQDRPFGARSQRFAELVHQGVLDVFADVGYDIRDRGALDDLQLDVAGQPGTHLIVLGPESERIVRSSQMPGALTEPAFITHADESLLLNDPDVQARLARAYADAIDAYFADAGASASP